MIKCKWYFHCVLLQYACKVWWMCLQENYCACHGSFCIIQGSCNFIMVWSSDVNMAFSVFVFSRCAWWSVSLFFQLQGLVRVKDNYHYHFALIALSLWSLDSHVSIFDWTLGSQFELKELKRKQEEEEEERQRQEELARQAAAPPPQSPDQPTDGWVCVCVCVYVCVFILFEHLLFC